MLQVGYAPCTDTCQWHALTNVQISLILLRKMLISPRRTRFEGVGARFFLSHRVASTCQCQDFSGTDGSRHLCTRLFPVPNRRCLVPGEPVCNLFQYSGIAASMLFQVLTSGGVSWWQKASCSFSHAEQVRCQQLLQYNALLSCMSSHIPPSILKTHTLHVMQFSHL